MTTNIVLTAQTEQKNTNSPELPTRLMIGVVVWTAMKIIRNWKVMMELLTRDFRSEENHSATKLIVRSFIGNFASPGTITHPKESRGS